MPKKKPDKIKPLKCPPHNMVIIGKGYKTVYWHCTRCPKQRIETVK